MRTPNLTILILKQIRFVAVQHSDRSVRYACSVASGLYTAARRFDSGHFNGFVPEKRVEETHRIRAAADAGDEHVRETLFFLENLLPRFLAEDGLEVPHHHRIRMRPRDTANDIKSVPDVRYPVPHGLVHRVFKRLSPLSDLPYSRTQKLHACYIERL